MSLLGDVKTLLSALKAEPRDFTAIFDAIRVLGSDVFGPSSFGAAGDDSAELKACCEETVACLATVQAPVGDGVGKLGDGKLIELAKFILPFILKFLV